MAKVNISINDTVQAWVNGTNALSLDVGDTALLTTAVDSDIVGAINSLNDRVDSDIAIIQALLDSNDTNFITKARTAISASNAIQYNSTTGVIIHQDTSTQASVDNSGATVIQDVTLDTYGHVTGLASKTMGFADVGAPSTSGTNATGTWSISVTGNAGTATILQTGRTINGTSFNGSANITTANWGTSRTIWGNSINGSVDITAPVRPAVGSVSAPAYSTSGDTNTGIYFSAADELSVTCGGSNQLTINNTTATFSGNVNTLSDARLKENVINIDNALTKVTNMRGVYFNRIGESQRQIGVIAQEVEAVVPELINENNGYKSVAYSNTIALLIEAIKELRDEINNIKERG